MEFIMGELRTRLEKIKNDDEFVNHIMSTTNSMGWYELNKFLCEADEKGDNVSPEYVMLLASQIDKKWRYKRYGNRK